MKKLIYPTLIAVISCICSCANDQETRKKTIKEYAANYASFLKEYEEPTQTFSIPANNPTDIVGIKGTVIKVDPDALETIDGSPLGNSIDVELKETKSKKDLLCSNLSTVSNGKLLISDGAFYLNMTSGNKQLKIKAGKTIAVEFPSTAEEPMELFYGERDKNDQFNWEQANQDLESKSEYDTAQPTPADTSVASEFLGLYYVESDSLWSEESLTAEMTTKLKRVFYPIELEKFGWINCDRFWKDERPKTDIVIKTAPEDTLEWISVHLLFTDINSLMHCHYMKNSTYEWANIFKEIPIGQQVQLLAVTYEGERILAYQESFTIKEDYTATLAMKEISESEFEQMIKKVK